MGKIDVSSHNWETRTLQILILVAPIWVFATGPWHEWTEHHGPPWQRTFSSRNPAGVRSIHARDLQFLMPSYPNGVSAFPVSNELSYQSVISKMFWPCG